MIVLLMALVIGTFALDPPKLQCIMLIDNNQKIRVNWSCDPVSCLNFIEYRFFINGNLSYTMQESPSTHLCDYGQADININITGTNSYECYMVAVDNDSVQYTSDTIRSISLNVTPSSNRTKAVLEWQSPTTSFDNTWGTSFFIYKKRGFETEFPNQPCAYVPVTTGNITYTDISDVCNNSLSYQVGITHSFTNGQLTSSCTFSSSIITIDNMIDDTRPKMPVIDSVTITPANKVMLGFHESEPYMKHFIIDTSKLVNGPFHPKTNVINGQTFWIDDDPTFNPNNEYKCYRIRAVDSCDNPSPITDSLWNMKLSLKSTDTCLKSATITWKKSDRPIRNIDHYEINISDDGGVTWRTIGTTTNNTETIEDLNYNQNYTVFVRAANADRSVTASSNRIKFSIKKPSYADFSYIQSVSVIDNQYIQIKALAWEKPKFESITLQKSEDGINFEDFKTQSYNPNQETYVFDDNQADVERETHYYRTFLTNSCKTASGYSNISHNIVLRGEDLDRANRLTWQGYDNWDGGVSDYFVIRKAENELSYSTIAGILPAVTNQYTDDISELYASGAKFTYLIEARENYNQYGFSETSYSNFVTVTQQPILFLPNAFRPNGTANKVFKPGNSYISFEQYRFSVFTRTGECIFITTDPQEGWNGRINGSIAPLNVYVYLIEYMLPDGTIAEQSGTVTLIK